MYYYDTLLLWHMPYILNLEGKLVMNDKISIPKSIGYHKYYDKLLNLYGPIDTAIFSVIERFSALSNKCCQLSYPQIGNEVHMEYQAVRRSIKRLLVAELIKLVEHEVTNKKYAVMWYEPNWNKMKDIDKMPKITLLGNVKRAHKKGSVSK
jgi:hypothetical protein